jgi:hypothetical protein
VVERRRRRIRGVDSAIATAAVLVTLVALSPVRAATLADVDLPDQETVDGKTLALNGLGLRRATFLEVEVYVIGLYLERKSGDAKAIIESSESKRIQMHFVRDVTTKQLRDAWKKGFEDNYEDVASIEDEIATFNASMRDVKAGDSMVLDFSGDAVGVLINGIEIDAVEGKPFQQALLGIWLGPKPPNDDLKKGILGH